MGALVVDTDVGFDDLLALAFLVGRGRVPHTITVCFGMSALAAGAERVRSFASGLGIGSTVVPGAPGPLKASAMERCLTAFSWGKEYRARFQDVADLVGAASDGPAAPAAAAGGPGAPDSNPAARALVELARGAGDGELDLLLLGPLTNVAQALALDGEGHLARATGRCVIMGGAVHVPGNSGDNAEFNFWKDPEAAAAVLASALPVELVGLEVANDRALTPAQRRAIAAGRPGASAPARAISRLLATMGDAADYDPVAAARLMAPGMFDAEAGAVAVINASTGEIKPGADAPPGWARVELTLCRRLHQEAYAAALAEAAGVGRGGGDWEQQR